ncbi:MAG: transporter substrate-binding domain-containing protein [Candidatus Limnocylindrales bacterium]
MTFRKPLIILPIALLLAACAAPGATTRPSTAATAAPSTPATATPVTAAPTTAPTVAATPTAAPTPSSVADACAGDLALKNPGRLTLSTDIPAFPPWWGGDAAEQYDNEPDGGSPWSATDFSAEPYSMEGFEGAIAYAVAQAMGFTADKVDWLANPDFALAFTPGEKPFDLHMAQISATADRAQAVTFSDPYFDSNQAVLALTTNDIINAASIEDLKAFRLGAAANTTSFTFLEDVIAPTTEVLNFPDNAGTLQALQGDVVDGIIVDLSTAFFMRDAQLEDFATDEPEGTIVGQFGPPAEPDHVAFVLELGSPLVDCVNQALAAVKDSGQHQQILDEWINTGQSVPFLE